MFASRWSSKLMSEEDRRKVFWLQKRKTSYTAWKARAEAFDRFAAIFEKQVIEEPLVLPPSGNPDWGTNWETSYPQILQAQVFYEQGLERLKRGDRTVWLYNELGSFHRSDSIEGYWHEALLNHGRHGDKFFEGKYVVDLMNAIKEVGKFSSVTARVVQPIWEDPMAYEFWSVHSMKVMEKGVKYPSHLPNVPIPESNTIVRTGEPVPCFGIYEPLVRDGCMNYLLEGVAAPEAVHADGGDLVSRPAAWRLLWKDERYFDGTVPLEESNYFCSAEPVQTTPGVEVEMEPVIERNSGEKAPRDGMWVVVDKLDVKKRFATGQVLPDYEGRNVLWMWVSKI